MPFDPVFGISILGSFAAFGVLAGLYVWPWLRSRSREEALRILILPHMFRFAGLSFLETGVVAASLPVSFATHAAYGDFIAAILAVAAVLALSARAPFAIAAVWLFNVWGTFDLIFAFYTAMTNGLVPGDLGAAYYIPTVIVPLLFISHALMFALLFSAESRVWRRNSV